MTWKPENFIYVLWLETDSIQYLPMFADHTAGQVSVFG